MEIYRKLITASLLLGALTLTACGDNNESDVENDLSEETVDENNQTDEEVDDEAELEEKDASSEKNEEEVEEETISIDMEEDLLKPDSVKALVNKQYALPEDYAPEDLVTVEVRTVQDNAEARMLRKVASSALTEMFTAAEDDGIELVAISGYRSYQRQKIIFNRFAENHGEEAANRYSARPGESEHQTGLAMDVTSESANYQLSEEFGRTPEGIWVAENAHDFGFIIRYPEGTEDITGYLYEPWHLRYFGEELATDIYETGLTYEEYLIERGVDIETSE